MSGTLQIVSTKQAIERGVNVALVGAAGSGKTTLASTAPAPIFLLSEIKGAFSIRQKDIPCILIKDSEDLVNAGELLANSDDEFFQSRQTVVIDSVTELANVLLAERKQTFAGKDKRQMYGDLFDFMDAYLFGRFNKLPKNVVYIFQSDKEDVMFEGSLFGTKYVPAFPGKAKQRDIPYMVNELFALRMDYAEGGRLVGRYLQCQPDSFYDCKDASGLLPQRIYDADLTTIFEAFAKNEPYPSEEVNNG